MESTVVLKIIGFVILLIGVVLTYNPELISSKPLAESSFEATERRVLWGLLIGAGLLLLLHHQLQPWLLTLAATGFALTFGVLIARLIGVAIDGSSLKQWYWIGAELMILAIFAFGYIKHEAIKQAASALFK